MPPRIPSTQPLAPYLEVHACIQNFRPKKVLPKSVVWSKQLGTTRRHLLRKLPRKKSIRVKSSINLRSQQPSAVCSRAIVQRKLSISNWSSHQCSGPSVVWNTCLRLIHERRNAGASAGSEQRPQASKKSTAPWSTRPLKPLTTFWHLLDMNAPLWVKDRGFCEKTGTERKNAEKPAPAQRDPSRSTRALPPCGAL